MSSELASKLDCTLVAFSQALECPVDTLIQCLGHDGKRVVFPELAEPKCYAGFHIQEWVDVCRKLGFALVLIEKECYSTPDGSPEHIHCVEALDMERFAGHLRESDGVLFGRPASGVGHAVAWKDQWILDRDSVCALKELRMHIYYFAKLIPLKCVT